MIFHRWAPLSPASNAFARFFPQAYPYPPSSSRDAKAAALGASRAHHALAHHGPPDDPTNQSSAMSALAASAAYAAPGAARALRRCAARARRELPAPRSPQKSLPGSFSDRREGETASPEAPPSPPARSARARVGGVPARPGASRARAARARGPRADPGARGAPSDPPRPRRRGGGPSHPTRRSITHVGGAALPARRSRRPLRRGSPRGRARVARSPIASRTRASSPRGRAEPRRAGAEERSDRTPPTFARTRQCTRLVLLGSNDVFHVLFFSFRSKFNAVQSPSSPPLVGPRRESSALRSPFASPR